MLALLLAALFWISDTQFCYTQVSPGVYTDCVNKVGEETYSDEYTTFQISIWSDGETMWAGNPYAQELGVITAEQVGAAQLRGKKPFKPTQLDVKGGE